MMEIIVVRYSVLLAVTEHGAKNQNRTIMLSLVKALYAFCPFKCKGQIMKKIISLLCALAFSASSIADHHIPDYAALETFSCNFMPGKDRDDLLAWAAKWDESATEIFSAPYTGMLNTPFLMNPTDQQHDIYWVGVSPDFTALGAVQDDYNAKAGNLQSALQRVVDCDSHAMWAVTTVRQNANSSLPSNGVATFSACTLAEGKTMEDMLAADAKMNAFLDKINQESAIWRWWPVSGLESTSEADFFEVTGNNSLKQKGAMMDNFVTNGGLIAQAAIYGDLLQCDAFGTDLFTVVGGKAPN